MRNSPAFLTAAALMAVFAFFASVNAASAADANVLPGTATVTGSVQAPKAFKAAKVYLMNTDKNVLFMVYTSAGRYRAVNLFPGNYEITVRTQGLASDTQNVALKAGARETVNIALREDALRPVRQGEFGSQSRGRDVQLVTYDELYPQGPGRALLEKNCLYCHGNNFFPSKQLAAPAWNAWIDVMMGGGPRGALVPPGTLDAQDREMLVTYLTQHYGPNSPPRGLKADAQFPVDEAALAKAMYMEYYLPLDPKYDKNNPRRVLQQAHFDREGNVWLVERTFPNRLARVDPRTGETKDYVLPDPKGGPHGLAVDRDGHVWWAEQEGYSIGRLDPKSGEMTRYPMDSSGATKGRGHSPVVDSKQNVWFTVITGDMLGKWDRATGKSTVWKVPTQGASPYGIVLDKDENVWLAEFRRCKVAKFDPRTEKFTEYEALTKPCTIRRLGVDSKGMVWYGGFNNGKLGKIDPASGKIVEYSIPMPHSEPYDVWADRSDNIWISDAGQGGTLIRFDQRSEKFTYYPTPQISDQPKIEITRDGAIWYTTRSGGKGAAGVLYPDMNNIKTFGAYY